MLKVNGGIKVLSRDVRGKVDLLGCVSLNAKIMTRRVSFEKLERYVESHGLYGVEKRGNDIIVTYTPSFPEAAFHKASETVSFRLHGTLAGKQVSFHRLEKQENDSVKPMNLEDMDPWLSVWLSDVEDTQT
ncbi:MAG: hypothetical protein ACE5PO_00840 [Candidatus Bathyarchaeia archaeon]